jgi:hypothetical protein
VSEPFIFGIPLIARAVSRDWGQVERLFALTLNSVLAQTDQHFQLLLAAHEPPTAWARVADDPRFQLIRATWPPEPVTAANDDGGAKKSLIKQAVRDSGGGLLMFLDADDWIARDLVEVARRVIGPDRVGGLVGHGFALDHVSFRLVPFPIGKAFDGPFHGLCGSSTIGRIAADGAIPHRLDPHAALGSHHEWEARAAAAGLSLAWLPTCGLYMVGTGQNHSETEGPFAGWRRDVTEVVRQTGTPLTAEMARTFGQDRATLEE